MTINSRIKKIQAHLQKHQRPKAILTYSDGSSRRMTWMEAMAEMVAGKDVLHVQYPGDTGCSLLAAMLPHTGGRDYWDDLEEVE